MSKMETTMTTVPRCQTQTESPRLRAFRESICMDGGRLTLLLGPDKKVELDENCNVIMHSAPASPSGHSNDPIYRYRIKEGTKETGRLGDMVEAMCSALTSLSQRLQASPLFINEIQELRNNFPEAEAIATVFFPNARRQDVDEPRLSVPVFGLGCATALTALGFGIMYGMVPKQYAQ